MGIPNAVRNLHFDLRIDSIAAGGDGVGRHEGIVVFVPRTAPGDLVRVSAVRQDRLMRGTVVELLTPSPDRVEPPCQHYVHDRCGGCQIQHLLYDAQLAAKAGIIRDSLARIGGVQTDRPDVEGSDRQWRYRRKLTLALRRRDDRWIAGLHRYDAPSEVFELRDCPITQEDVLRGWKSILDHQHLLPHSKELRGAVRMLGAGFSFTLEGSRVWATHSQLFAAIPRLAELWWVPEAKSRRLLHSRTLSDEAGASFTQVNPAVAERLRACVVSLATATQPHTVVDAYAGTGDIAVALAERGTRVTAIEIDRDAARVCASRLPEGSRAIAAPVEEALPQALPADVVVLNPPRAGVDARVTTILRAHPPRIIYVSCNPATLARDIKRLEVYRVKTLRGFDMFPQTAHVETVCELVAA
jgi:23S rRNA (uracil1939-C5)-methyltransferase